MYILLSIQCFQCFKCILLTVQYLWLIFVPGFIGNAIKQFHQQWCEVLRSYFSLWKPICLLVKITHSDEIFYVFLVNLVATVALARNLVGLLHSNSAEKSNKTVKPATVLQYMLQYSTERLYQLQTYCLLSNSVTLQN